MGQPMDRMTDENKPSPSPTTCVGGGYGRAITFVSWLYLTQHIVNEKYAQHILRPKTNWAAFYVTINSLKISWLGYGLLTQRSRSRFL